MRVPKKNWIWITRDYKKENGPYKTRDYLFQKHIDDFFILKQKENLRVQWVSNFTAISYKLERKCFGIVYLRFFFIFSLTFSLVKLVK